MLNFIWEVLVWFIDDIIIFSLKFIDSIFTSISNKFAKKLNVTLIVADLILYLAAATFGLLLSFAYVNADPFSFFDSSNYLIGLVIYIFIFGLGFICRVTSYVMMAVRKII